MKRKDCAQDWIKGGRIISVTADHDKKMVVVNMYGCPDFIGGIRFGEFIMPGVKQVVYLWEGAPDVLYFKADGGKWASRDLRIRAARKVGS